MVCIKEMNLDKFSNKFPPKQKFKKMKKLFVLSVCVFMLFFSQNILAQKGDWERIGQQKVDYRVEKDVFNINSKRGKFTKLQIRVKGADVNFRDMKVYFGNGSVQDVSLRNVIKAGSESRVIDLDGNERNITKIEFIYDTKNDQKHKATVAVFAKD